MDVSLVPAAVRSLITSDVARELALVYGDQVVLPERIVVHRPGNSEGFFADWSEPVLVISYENQGVCAWGVPLGDPNPRVLVSGNLVVGGGQAQTVEYTPNVEGFVAARLWDRACLSREPLLQAQAAELDEQSIGRLRSRFEELPATTGWPGLVQHRFQKLNTRIMLWSGNQQCDWWISDADIHILEQVARELVDLSDLRMSLWSNDSAGSELLANIRNHM